MRRIELITSGRCIEKRGHSRPWELGGITCHYFGDTESMMLTRFEWKNDNSCDLKLGFATSMISTCFIGQSEGGIKRHYVWFFLFLAFLEEL